ncbi:MAG: 30S ribosomal protein S5 [Phycisphaerae bacterium]
MGRFRPREREPDEGPAYDDNVVKIYRCSKVVKGGRRFSFAALVVVGDRNGRVGVGYGKANEVPSAVEKGRKRATRDLNTIQLQDSTIPHEIVGRFGSSRVLLRPAPRGTGVIAGASVRAVLELAGVGDCLTKVHGSTSPKNLAKATLQALLSLRDRRTIEKLRGVSLAAH